MKKLVSLFLIITIITVTINSDVYGFVGTVDTYISGLKNICDMFVSSASPDEQQTIQMMDKLLQAGGFISDIEKVGLDGALAQPFIRYMASQIEANQAEASMQDNIACIKEALENGYSSDGNHVNISGSFKTALVNTANYYADEQLTYLYSYTDKELSSFFVNTNAYVAAREMITSNLVSQEYWFLCSYSTVNRLYAVSKQFPYLYFRADSTNIGNNSANGYLMDGGNNALLGSPDITMYVWDGTEWKASETYTFTSFSAKLSKNNITPTPSRMSNIAYFISLDNSIAIKANRGQASVSDILYQPYYYNNDVWQDFSSSNGDYTWSPSNINTVTYGDVTSYIDNSNTENGYPPNIQDINIHIEDKDEENKDTSDGGGSDGGGSGDGDSGTGIFDLLKGLGKVIADFIKGLVAVITEVIGAIGEAIASITSVLPNTISSLLGIVFDFLPPEITALISLGIVAMVTVGIIKLFKG